MLSQAISQRSLSISEELTAETVQLKTVKELLDFVQIFDSPYECSYPIELDVLLDRIIMFRVNVKQENIESRDRVYEVAKISDDEELINQYKKSTKEDVFTNFVYDNEKISPKKMYISKRGRPKSEGPISEVTDDVDQLSSNKAKKVIKKEKNP
ncbi:hypothetical protein FXO38_03400 [Capsicum annuum]|nr:hypothetical protein FXO38_03400 [Capsicum annuum]